MYPEISVFWDTCELRFREGESSLPYKVTKKQPFAFIIYLLKNLPADRGMLALCDIRST